MRVEAQAQPSAADLVLHLAALGGTVLAAVGLDLHELAAVFAARALQHVARAVANPGRGAQQLELRRVEVHVAELLDAGGRRERASVAVEEARLGVARQQVAPDILGERFRHRELGFALDAHARFLGG